MLMDATNGSVTDLTATLTPQAGAVVVQWTAPTATAADPAPADASYQVYRSTGGDTYDPATAVLVATAAPGQLAVTDTTLCPTQAASGTAYALVPTGATGVGPAYSNQFVPIDTTTLLAGTPVGGTGGVAQPVGFNGPTVKSKTLNAAGQEVYLVTVPIVIGGGSGANVTAVDRPDPAGLGGTLPITVQPPTAIFGPNDIQVTGTVPGTLPGTTDITIVVGNGLTGVGDHVVVTFTSTPPGYVGSVDLTPN